MVVEGIMDGRIMEFGYALAIGGGISTLLSLLICDSIFYEKTPYRLSFGSVNWNTVMFNMFIGGSVVYLIMNVDLITNGQGDNWTPWIVGSMILLAILMSTILILDANSTAKKVAETKQMWTDFNTWLLSKGKSMDKGFNNLVNNAIDEVRPDMVGRMEGATYNDLKEFSQEKYPDFYKYLIQMEGIGVTE